jgi:hypothetical protein
MTRRDFELIAGTVKYIRDLKTTDEDTLDLLAWAFATELGRNNQRFDTPRFLKACGLAS